MPSFWSSQPRSVAGTIGASTASITDQLTEFSISEAAENFSLISSDKKYSQDGGNISNSSDISMTVFDMNLLESSQTTRGAYWVDVTAIYAPNGPSALSAGFSVMTVTIASMRVVTSGISDQGGRIASTVGFEVLSIDGSTGPIVYTVT